MEKQNYLTKEETGIFIKAFLSYSVVDDDPINELNENLEENPINKDNKKPIKTRRCENVFQNFNRNENYDILKITKKVFHTSSFFRESITH